MDNVQEWTSLLVPELLMMAARRKHLKRMSAESSLMSLLTTPLGQGTAAKGSRLVSGRTWVRTASAVLSRQTPWVTDTLIVTLCRVQFMEH